MTDIVQPLRALLGQAEAARDAAQVELQRALAAQQAAQAQLDELDVYRRQYEQRYAAQFARQAAGIDVVRCYQSFMQRLSQAIEQQRHVAQERATRLEAARSSLQQRELQVASTRKLIERREEALRREATQRERRQADEAAARSAVQRRPDLLAFGAVARGIAS
jgi:flagellar FliJ protein